MEDENELLDLVDKNDRVIGSIKRTAYYQLNKKPEGYLRATAMFIRNKKGQLWVPRRTPGREIAPNGLDYSCGGHVTSGEDYLTSLVREAKEELNVDIDPRSTIFIGKFYATAIRPWIMCLYLYEQDEVPHYNKKDFIDYYWLSPQDLLTKLENGEPAKASMLEAVCQGIDKLTLVADD
jgi:isopentenyl-diphosphate delta-isomerase